MSTDTGRAAPSQLAAMVVRALAAAAIAVVTVIGLAAADVDRARRPADLSTVKVGQPFAWVTQDQSSVDPPDFPRDLRAGSPWEYPTDVAWLWFGVDVAVVAGLILCFFTLRRAFSRR